MMFATASQAAQQQQQQQQQEPAQTVRVEDVTDQQ
jgi:hypothetical protein